MRFTRKQIAEMKEDARKRIDYHNALLSGAECGDIEYLISMYDAVESDDLILLTKNGFIKLTELKELIKEHRTTLEEFLMGLNNWHIKQYNIYDIRNSEKC